MADTRTDSDFPVDEGRLARLANLIGSMPASALDALLRDERITLGEMLDVANASLERTNRTMERMHHNARDHSERFGRDMAAIDADPAANRRRIEPMIGGGTRSGVLAFMADTPKRLLAFIANVIAFERSITRLEAENRRMRQGIDGLKLQNAEQAAQLALLPKFVRTALTER